LTLVSTIGLFATFYSFWTAFDYGALTFGRINGKLFVV